MTDVLTPPITDANPSVAATGIAGLDDILGGGFVPNRLYLIEGVSGSGKTTLALQYLLEGARNGERVLHVTLCETEEELRAVAASHGWSLDAVDIHETLRAEGSLGSDEQYTMFHPSEVEPTHTTEWILKQVERLKPSCLDRFRFAFGSSSAGWNGAALSQADAGAQALLLGAKLHRAPAR